MVGCRFFPRSTLPVGSFLMLSAPRVTPWYILTSLPDFCGFTDNNTRAVIDKKVIPNSSTGMNVYSCFTVGVFTHDSWDKRDLK